ncbi:SDR family NAD(P)-dependent oxidoreductase [Streptomyces roseolus]|uniref:SDR family NAD(P)-dependent oxidoreductase n=1 Tax=Streptomyces roseolus TaxID=67358 RepID=UPI00365FD74E
MSPSAYGLTGRTAFVTGAASGIGRAGAVLLARAGMNLHPANPHLADRDEPGLEETAAPIAREGGTVHPRPLDVTDCRVLAVAVGAAGTPHVRAAAAGICTSTVLETREEDLGRVLAVNFKGVLHACQEAARSMISSGTRGPIVTMPRARWTPRVPACSATASPSRPPSSPPRRSRSRRARTASGSTRSPGWIRAPLTDRHEPAAQERAEAAMVRHAPLRRVGEPEDIAHAVRTLACDASSFTTGQIPRPNGGVAMPW